MLIYILIIFLAWILSLSPNLKKSKKIQTLFAVGLILFLCFGYMTGSDWRSYEKWYDWANPFFIFGGYKEPGYYLYMLPFRLLGVKFWPFFIFTKIILFIVIFKFIQRLYPDNVFLFWMYFLPLSGFFIFIDNPMRNLIAVVIFLLSFKHLVNRSFIKYFAYTLLAMSFHSSAIIMLFIYFLVDKRFKSNTLIISFIIVNILFSSQQILKEFIELAFSHFPNRYIEAMIVRFFYDKNSLPGSFISFGLILNTIWFFLILFYRKSIENNLKFGFYVFNLAILYPFLYRLGLTMQPLVRFQLFLVVFFVIAIISVLQFLEPKLKNGYIIFLFIISLIFSKSLMSPKYVPYSNYLHYVILNEYPSYEYRCTYNYEHSPYK